jgi:hypothetical protein
MSGASSPEDELREEYDFTPEQLRSAERGRYAARYAEFPDSASVNQALRALLTVIRAHNRQDEAA